jgi:hypothetical protein
MSYRRSSNGFTHIFDHARINDDTADTVRRRPTSEIQNGEHETGITLYLRNGMTYRRNSNGLSHIFDHARTNSDTADIARCRLISAIQNTQNGGL